MELWVIVGILGTALAVEELVNQKKKKRLTVW
jgi:hypothetical protein